MKVIKRDGSGAPFEAGRIVNAVDKAFAAVEGNARKEASVRIAGFVAEALRGRNGLRSRRFRIWSFGICSRRDFGKWLRLTGSTGSPGTWSGLGGASCTKSAATCSCRPIPIC